MGLKKGDKTDIDTLATYCGFFVGNCKNHCNNGYGCTNPKNTEGDTDCNIHPGCHAQSCPLSFQVEEDSDEVELIEDL